MVAEHQNGHLLPTSEVLRAIVREECTAAVQAHLAACPLMVTGVEPRLRSVETRLATLIGVALGSGLLGGAAGSLATKLLS
jgi:hypothetical protein